MQSNSSQPETEFGVLLINLGTPKSPTKKDIRRYLREFLSDPKVMTMKPALRWTLVNLIIVPFRPKRLVPAYKMIWLDDGSPLLVYSRALREALATQLGDQYFVDLAMRYQAPDIGSALSRMKERGVRKLIVLPQFPQYSESATGSIVARVKEKVEELGSPFEVEMLYDFHDAPGFIRAQAETARPLLAQTEWDHVLFSYHGLPESQIRAVTGCLATEDCCQRIRAIGHRCYRAQCFETSRALAESLKINPDRWSTSFQSRLTREPWIKPYTDFVLPELYDRGVRTLFVMCPSFTADNLETAEEVNIRLRAQWAELGGTAFEVAACVNDSPTYAEALAQWVTQLAES